MFRIQRMLAAVSIVAITLAGSTLSAATTKAKTASLVGTLQKVDGQTLTVQTSKGTETVTLAPNAHIVHGSKTVAASDLSSATGSRVKVRYMTSNGQKQAEAVTVSAAKPAPTHKKA